MEKINEFKRHKSGVSAASFSPDGKNILTSFDKTAVI
jgi:WD40 repeat protein